MGQQMEVSGGARVGEPCAGAIDMSQTQMTVSNPPKRDPEALSWLPSTWHKGLACITYNTGQQDQ